MKEPFWDERPTPSGGGWFNPFWSLENPEWYGGGRWGSWRGYNWGVGGWSDDGGFDFDEIWFELTGEWTLHEQLILLDGEGYVLLSPEGEILQGMNGCINIKVECQIQGDSGGQHVRCLLLTNSLDPEVTGTLLDKFPASSTKLFVRWQTGHYPHSSINTARFRINGKVSSWFTLPLQGSYVEFAEVAVRDGIVSVKYLL
jgi:hypothetical protein